VTVENLSTFGGNGLTAETKLSSSVFPILIAETYMVAESNRGLFLVAYT
jgi:hypothetical protein